MKRKIAIAAALLTVILAAACFAGCEQALSNDEAFERLAEAVAAAKDPEQQGGGWFVKVKVTESATRSTEDRLYVKQLEDGSKQARYDRSVTDNWKTESESFYWGKASKVKENKKDEDVFKTGKLSWVKDKADKKDEGHWAIDDTITLDDFLDDESVAPYTLDAVCAYLDDYMTADKMTIASAKTSGWVTYVYAKEIKEGFLSGCSDIEIRITKDRLSNIYYKNANGQDVQVNIVYGDGINLSLPQWE